MSSAGEMKKSAAIEDILMSLTLQIGQQPDVQLRLYNNSP